MRMHEIQHTKASHTYSLLKEHIRRLDLKTGTHLEVDILAKVFQSSVTPVREALSRLSCESLIELQPNRGYFIRRVDLSEQMSLHEVGDIILGYSCHRLNRFPLEFDNSKITPEHYCSFLELVVRTAGNPELSQMFQNLMDRTFGMIALHLQREEAKAAAAEDIFDFLNTPDPALAFGCLRRLRQRLAGELPQLVKESSMRVGGSIAQFAGNFARRQT
ncbi:GntR family transcriptional regulator [Phyllobacterium sp. 22552]|uniref:GntR family transcriptional regulator n=1 Tax=Phyllobacterium sp. 22552 TaxID=3453941 RepID=UPI003F82DFE1